MTPEQQRIAIAEACGWENIPWEKASALGHLVALKPDKSVGFMPDYLNDLNAMHEAESARDFHHDQRWIENLVQIGLRESALTLNKSDGWDWSLVCARSTAAQRAEAFLRTVGRWVEP